MAEYYARIDNGKVIDTQVVSDELVAELGEQAGADLLSDLFDGQWVRFSRDGEFIYNRVAIGSLYDSVADAFYDRKPFDSWTLDTETYQWQPPVVKPGDNFYWDEVNQTWNQTILPQ